MDLPRTFNNQTKCLWLWWNFIKSDYLICEKSYANYKSRLIVQWIAQYNLWCSTRVSSWSYYIWYIYICDPFFVNKNVNFYNYADDTTPFITVMSFEKIVRELEKILSDMSLWFMNKTSYWTCHNGLWIITWKLMLEKYIFFSAHMKTKQ